MRRATLREAGLSLGQVVPTVGHLSSTTFRGTAALGFAFLCVSCAQPAATTANIGGPDASRAYSGSSLPPEYPTPNYTTIDFLDPYHYGGTGGF